MSTPAAHRARTPKGALTGRVDPCLLAAGHVVARIVYEKVDGLAGPADDIGYAFVVDLDRGDRYVLPFYDLAGCYSADLHEETQPCGPRELADALMLAGDRPFTVEFLKKDGTPRTLRGHLISTDHARGSSLVVDLDLPVGGNIRQVDHATLRSLVVNNVRRALREDA